MEEKKIPYKIYLSEDEMPRAWYNVRADMTNKPAPLLDGKTMQPITAEALGNLFAKASRKASSNYGIGSDGKIGLYVHEKDRSMSRSLLW